MQSFTFRVPRSRILSGLGRNPLVRVSDRIESAVTLIAVVVVMLAIPIAAAIETAEHDRLSSRYAENNASLSQVDATVADTAVLHRIRPDEFAYATPVHWVFDGTDHSGTVDRQTRLHTGDSVSVWIDETGSMSSGPVPAGRATRDAVTVAVAFWALIAGGAASIACLVQWRLNVSRAHRWNRELDQFADDGSRH
jgi:hypothetical protein